MMDQQEIIRLLRVTVAPVIADFVRDLRRENANLRSELRHALAALNSRCSAMEAANPNGHAVEIASQLEQPLKEYLRDEVATQVAVMSARDES